MKRTVWNITLASVLTLVAYIALYAIWGAILSEVEDPAFRLLLIALMTTVAFGYFLLYTSKIRRLVGEDEVRSDYKDKAYISFVEDLKLILKREAKMLACIIVIVLLCFALNAVDSVVFGKKVLSFPAFFFAPMCLLDSVCNVPFVGYALSALLDCFAYLVFLLLYRKKKYDYWMKDRV